MKLFRRLRGQKPTPPPPPCQPKIETSPLVRLPAEILNHITTFLPLSSSAHLAMTCKTNLEKLGQIHFTRLSPGRPKVGYRFAFEDKLTHIQVERQEFLVLLERDIPSMIFCFCCKTIHDPLKTNEYRNYAQICKIDEFDRRVFEMRDCNYSRRHMLMKRYRLGLDITAELKHFSRSGMARQTLLRQYTTRIIDGKFMVRTQIGYCFPPEKASCGIFVDT